MCVTINCKSKTATLKEKICHVHPVSGSDLRCRYGLVGHEAFAESHRPTQDECARFYLLHSFQSTAF